MKKILFLDIDDVIATHESNYNLDLNKQLLLKEIVDKTNCEIVLSSSRRKHSLLETKEYMDKLGFILTHKIIGVTIRAYQWIEFKHKIHLAITRGIEIKQWLDTNLFSNNGKNFKRNLKFGVDYTYCIVDDDIDMLYEHKDKFVRINRETGLTKKDVKKIIKILNTDNYDDNLEFKNNFLHITYFFSHFLILFFILYLIDLLMPDIIIYYLTYDIFYGINLLLIFCVLFGIFSGLYIERKKLNNGKFI